MEIGKFTQSCFFIGTRWKLALALREKVKEHYGRDLPERAVRLMAEIASYDGTGTTFRYSEGFTEGE